MVQELPEIDRLIACLETANNQAEEFERNWWLRGDQLESLQARNVKLVALLKECEVTLGMWADVAPAVSLRADIRAALAGD